MAISVEEARAMTEEQLQETITEIAFEIIANVGTARGMYIEAIQEAKAGHFDQAEQLMKDGKEAFVQGHHGHADLLEWQGQGLTWKTNKIFLYLIQKNSFLYHLIFRHLNQDNHVAVRNDYRAKSLNHKNPPTKLFRL